MRVLVTGAGAVLGQGIIKSLRMSSHPYEIIGVDPDPRAVGLYWADQAYLIPLASDPRYGEAVEAVLREVRPSVVLIGTDVELMYFAEHKDEIETRFGARVIVSPPEAIRIANDKWLTYQFLLNKGFPYPESALPSDVDQLIERCGFPLIVKPRIGARSVGVHKVFNQQQLNQALAAVEAPIIQECVSTPEHEYTSGVTIVDNQVKAVVTMRRDLKDGNTHRAYVVVSDPFEHLLAAMAKQLGGEGVINFQFRVDAGVPKVFEINARFSGTTPFRAYAGFNEVDHLIRYYVYGTPIPPPKLSPIVILRYLDEVVVYSEQLQHLAEHGSLKNPTFWHPFRLQ